MTALACRHRFGRGRSAIVASIVLMAGVAVLTQAPPTPVGDFRGAYSGSYRMPETNVLVRLSVTLKPEPGQIRIRWSEALGPEEAPVEAPRVFDVTGVVKGPQVRFSTPRASLFPRATYTAVRWGSDLLVHLPLHFHPEGFFSDESCDACEEVVKEIRLTPR